MTSHKLRSKAPRTLVESAKNIYKYQRIDWKNFQVVVLTLNSSKNDFTWHVKFEKYQKSRFFKKLMLDEFFVGWVLTIKHKNFRCCGTFLSQNSSWCTSSINFLKKSFFDNFRFLNCGFVDFIGRILIYPAEYRPIGHIFGKYTLITLSTPKCLR